MGKLVTFELRPRQRPAPAAGTTGDARILIFTGVRYERDGLAQPPKRSDPDKPRRRRG